MLQMRRFFNALQECPCTVCRDQYGAMRDGVRAIPDERGLPRFRRAGGTRYFLGPHPFRLVSIAAERASAGTGKP